MRTATISAVNKPSGSPGRSFITIQRFGRNRKNLHGAANPLALYRGTRGERCDEQCGTGTEHGTRQFSGLHGRGEIPRLGPEQSGDRSTGRRRVRSIPPSSTPIGITVSTFSRTSSVKKNSATSRPISKIFWRGCRPIESRKSIRRVGPLWASIAKAKISTGRSRSVILGAAPPSGRAVTRSRWMSRHPVRMRQRKSSSC